MVVRIRADLRRAFGGDRPGGPGIAYAQGATAGLQARWPLLYSQANNYATLGQGVANGNLSSVVTASNLAANQVPPGQMQSVLKSVGTTVAEATLGYTMTTALLTQGLTVLGATAAEVASAVPVLGTAVAAMIIATAAVLKLWGASGAGSATMPPLGLALLSVPLPIPTTTSSQGLTSGIERTFACQSDRRDSGFFSPRHPAARARARRTSTLADTRLVARWCLPRLSRLREPGQPDDGVRGGARERRASSRPSRNERGQGRVLVGLRHVAVVRRISSLRASRSVSGRSAGESHWPRRRSRLRLGGCRLARRR